jgi:hypothetical protein
VGTHHNALSDAVCQARHLLALYKAQTTPAENSTPTNPRESAST